MSSIQSLLESANPWKSLQGDAAKLASKWSKTGLLEGFGSEVERNNMALILENQAKQLVVEASQTGASPTAGTFTVGQSEKDVITTPVVNKEDKDYRVKCKDMENVALDFAESQLHKQIMKGNPLSTIFFLKCKGKKRGYIEQQDIKVTGNIVTGVVTTLSGSNATYTTGNFTTANATTGNIVTGVVTTISGTAPTPVGTRNCCFSFFAPLVVSDANC